MIYAVLDHPDLDRADLSSLETIMYGASPISPTRLAEGLDRMGPVFCQLYGQTECSGIATSLWRCPAPRRRSAPAHVVRHGDARRPSHGARR
jgi:acyl-CoA synthetase (AMP-forming)/AMP-acid ligase II